MELVSFGQLKSNVIDRAIDFSENRHSLKLETVSDPVTAAEWTLQNSYPVWVFFKQPGLKKIVHSKMKVIASCYSAYFMLFNRMQKKKTSQHVTDLQHWNVVDVMLVVQLCSIFFNVERMFNAKCCKKVNKMHINQQWKNVAISKFSWIAESEQNSQ